MFNKIKNGFTLAEVLITLVVIGVIAAVTIPTVISKYRKTTVETRLKASYSNLSNALKRAEVDHGSIPLWDFSDVDVFVNKYIIPYVANIKNYNQIKGTHISDNWRYLYLSDGTLWMLQKEGSSERSVIHFIIDINGDAKPNKTGYDRFSFYLFPFSSNQYIGFGNDNVAMSVPVPGLYYDGYRLEQNRLLNSQYRGCNDTCTYGDMSCRAYCTALIVKNSWKIPDDYPFNL